MVAQPIAGADESVRGNLNGYHFATVTAKDHFTLGALTARTPHWPESTRSVSELRLSMRVRPKGMLSGLSGPRTIHLDIVDYPGEWLLDLGLLDKSYEEWSTETLARLALRQEAAEFRAVLEAADPAAPLDEPQAKALASAFTTYLNAARDAGFYDCTPGRFLLPGELQEKL